jgi:signal transduction histidine kinase
VRRVDVRVSKRYERVHIEVEDTGPGLPPGSHDTVFDPYVRYGRSTTDGTGLGLATVKRLVDAHGGHIEVSSRPGCTRFRFDLPRADVREAHEGLTPRASES